MHAEPRPQKKARPCNSQRHRANARPKEAGILAECAPARIALSTTGGALFGVGEQEAPGHYGASRDAA